MTIGPPPVCIDCRHFRGNVDDDPPTCDAFPEGIPEQVWWDTDSHTEPIDGDHGVRFEQS